MPPKPKPKKASTRNRAASDDGDGRLTYAAGGLVAQGGRRELVDAETAHKLARLIETDDPQMLERPNLEMIASAANHYRRHHRDGPAGDEQLTVADLKAWVLHRQMNPTEGIPPPEPEPEPLQRQFEIKVGYAGRLVGQAAAATPTDFGETFHVVVTDDARRAGAVEPRSVTVWRLGGASSPDRRVASAVLHGARAVRCSNAHPPGAFQLELANMPANILEGEEGAASLYFLPGAEHSSEELVAFFNKCGSDPPRVIEESAVPESEPEPRSTSSGMPQPQVQSAPLGLRGSWSGGPDGGGVGSGRLDSHPSSEADVTVLTAKITGTEEVADKKDGKVTLYLVECTPVSVAEHGAQGWVVRKRYSQFDEFRKELEAADSSSDVETLGLKGVKFPAKTWGLGAVGAATVEQRQQGLEEWLNKIIGLNNALLCSDHRELAEVVGRFLRPQHASARPAPLTMDQIQVAKSPRVGAAVAGAAADAREAEAAELGLHAAGGAWGNDQITGRGGFLHSFEDQLFPQPAPMSKDGGAEVDCEERAVVHELQRVLEDAASGGGVSDAASKVLSAVEAELQAKDDTIRALEAKLRCAALAVGLRVQHAH